MQYHSDSQYPHIDCSAAEFARIRGQIEQETLLYFRMRGSRGRIDHVPIFVGKCPDGEEPPALQWMPIENLDDIVVDAEIVDD